MNYAMEDLRSFLTDTDAAGKTLYIDKPVDVETEAAALCSQTTRPTLFNTLKGHKDFQLVDCLTRFRDTQALALGIETNKPEKVLSTYLGRLSKGPGSTITIDKSPVKEVILIFHHGQSYK